MTLWLFGAFSIIIVLFLMHLINESKLKHIVTGRLKRVPFFNIAIMKLWILCDGILGIAFIERVLSSFIAKSLILLGLNKKYTLFIDSEPHTFYIVHVTKCFYCKIPQNHYGTR